MAVAYAHLHLGSPQQVMHFIGQRTYELEHTIEYLGNERTMWSKVLKRFGTDAPDAICKHAGARQRKLSNDIAIARGELDTLKKLYEALQPCPECKGTGEYHVAYDQDDIKILPCKTCKGSGTTAPTT